MSDPQTGPAAIIGNTVEIVSAMTVGSPEQKAATRAAIAKALHPSILAMGEYFKLLQAGGTRRRVDG